MSNYDVIITGSGPNGIAAAIQLQQKGLKTLIIEQANEPGGAVKTEELTLPGFQHDVGAAIMPMGIASPFFRNLPLEQFGLEWVFPEIPYAHPFPDGSAIACYKDIHKTAGQLEADKDSYLRLFKPIIQNWKKIENNILGPLSWPDSTVNLLKFGVKALPPARNLVNRYFKEEKTKSFFYGAAAHSSLPLTNLASASFGLVLASLAHQYNWPFPKGGAENFIKALLKYYQSIGGVLELNKKVSNLNTLPTAKAYLFDLTPRQLLKIEGTDFSAKYRKQLSNYNYGAGVFKIDWALSGAIPFINDKCRKAGTVHLGFSPEELEISEAKIHKGKLSDKPYVLLAQHSNFDNSRAPKDKYTAWAYCHVPHGSTADCTAIIENQIERVAPGFKDIVLKRSTLNTRKLESFNPNLVGGDINGGKPDITQLFTRPIISFSPYATSNKQIYICSSSTPPGGGVHGMCGFHAAQKVLKDHFQDLTE